MDALLRSRVLAVMAVLGLGGAVLAQPGLSASSRTGAVDPLMGGYVFNVIDWDGGPLPPRYERSDQLPLTLADVRKLSRSGFSDEAVVKMIQERRCACDASVDALVELKAAGVSERVIRAVSLHALPPNRSIYLVITIDFEGLGGSAEVSSEARRRYLYLIVPDGTKERVFIADLGAVLAGRWQHDTVVDQTDLLLPKRVRRVAFAAEVPLKQYGPRQVLVFTSSRPNIYTSADIPEAERDSIQAYELDYPPSSLERICDLRVLYRQDQMLPDQWHLVRTDFQCEWD